VFYCFDKHDVVVYSEDNPVLAYSCSVESFQFILEWFEGKRVFEDSIKSFYDFFFFVLSNLWSSSKVFLEI
jgi:hypothetical protein